MDNPFADFEQLGEPPQAIPAPRATNPFAGAQAEQAVVVSPAQLEFASPRNQSAQPQGPQPQRLPPRYDRVLATKKLKSYVSRPLELDRRGNLNASCVANDGYFTAGDNNLRQWNLSSGKCEHQIKIKDGSDVRCMVYNAGWIWCGRSEGELQGIHISSGEVKDAERLDSDIVAITPASKTTAWALSATGVLGKYDLRRGTVLSRSNLGPHSHKRALNTDMVCIPHVEQADGEVWVLWLGSIFVLNEESGSVSMAKTMPRNDATGVDPVTAMARVQGARWCANASGKVSAWVQGELLGEIPLIKEVQPDDLCTSIARTNDGLLWCARSTGEVTIVSPGHEASILSWMAHNSSVKAVHATMQDGKATVATLSEYGSVRFWKIDTGGLMAAYDAVQRGKAVVSELSLNIRVLTWNVNEWTPFGGASRQGVANWLVGNGDSDIIVLGIQEAVPLNASQAVATDLVSEQWEDYLKLCLEKVGLYVMVATVQLVGVVNCVFLRSDFVHAIGGVETAVVKVGFKGLLGNKGAACIRFELFEDTVLLVCTHLAAGQKDVKSRNEHFKTITEQLHFPTSNTGFAEHDHIIWYGDLNYRIDLPNERAQDWATLYAEDQLNKTRQAANAFSNFDEAPLLFAPTYKYDHGTQVYDTSKKKRQPAWCDRVLWRKSSKIRPRAYGRSELLQSDHRPVFADLEIDIKIVSHSNDQQVEVSPAAALPPAPAPVSFNTSAPAPVNTSVELGDLADLF